MKNNSKNKIAKWLIAFLILLALAGLGITIHHHNSSRQVKVEKKWRLKKTKSFTDKDKWGYPFKKCYMKKIKYKSGQKYGKTDVLRRYYPSKSYFHDGWDFGWGEVGKSAKVLAVHYGTVKKVDYCYGLGWFIWVVSDDGYVEIYQEGFNFKSDIFVKKGQKIKLGQTIGKMTGTHLHLGITKTSSDYITKKGYPYKWYWKDNGTWLNPMTIIQDSFKKEQEVKDYNKKVLAYNKKAREHNHKIDKKLSKNK